MPSVLEFISKNFFHALPILVIGVIAIGIMADRFVALYVKLPLLGRAHFLERIRELVLADKIQDAVALCDQYGKKPVGQVVKEGLMRAHLPEEMINDGLNLVVGEWADRITKRTGFLSMIANVSTLMGLFGTILGLIESFKAVGFADPQQKAQILASGISTAMNATMLGLAVAIPCMFVFSFLMNKSNRMVGELDQTMLATLDIIRQRSYGLESIKRTA